MKIWNRIKAWLEPWSYPEKPKNQMRHFDMGMKGGWLFGLLHWAAVKVPGTQMYLWLLALVGAIMFSMNFERNQCAIAVEKSKELFKKGLIDKPMTSLEYWRLKLLDSLLDVIFSVLGAFLGMLPWWIMSGF